MFAVGNGRAPAFPESITEEGKDFLKCCFELDPEERWTANVLLDHPFIKVCCTQHYIHTIVLKEQNEYFVLEPLY